MAHDKIRPNRLEHRFGPGLITTHLDEIVEAKVDWAKLTGIGMVKRETTKIANPTKTTTETAYFIGSVVNITDFAKTVRMHSGVESMHWSLDVTFGDDVEQQ